MNSPLSPFRIFIGGTELLGWTEASLTRSKKEMTGTLSVAVFFTYMPRTPVMRNAVAGAEVKVFVGGHLAFVGTLDDRQGKSKGKSNGGFKTAGAGKAKSIGAGKHTKGGALSTSITAEKYIITLRARGKTKPLIDSSHSHKTGTILGATTRKAIKGAIDPHPVALEWLAQDLDMDKIRYRDGITCDEEIHRVCNEYGMYAYETREGKLRITDGTGGMSGEPLILGDNILEFSAEQSEEPKNSEIKIKGQRTKKNVRGKQAVNRSKTVQMPGATSYRPLNLAHDTDATDEALERRARHEVDKRNQDAKQVRVDVFHVQSRTGMPWDIGATHYVEVPTEGIFEEMECIELTYVVAHDKKLHTQLVLAPLPGSANGIGGMSGIVGMLSGGRGLGAISGGIGSILNGTVPGIEAFGGLAGINALLAGVQGIAGVAGALTDWAALGQMRRSQLGIEYIAGQYPESWGRAAVQIVNGDINGAFGFAVPANLADAIGAIAQIPGDVVPQVALPDFNF